MIEGMKMKLPKNKDDDDENFVCVLGSQNLVHSQYRMRGWSMMLKELPLLRRCFLFEVI